MLKFTIAIGKEQARLGESISCVIYWMKLFIEEVQCLIIFLPYQARKFIVVSA